MLDHDKVARYFERVLGVTRLDGANDLVLSEPSSIGADLLLVDLSTAVKLPSLAEMAVKLADAVKGEWVSVSVNDSTNEWNLELEKALNSRPGIKGILVFGAQEIGPKNLPILLVPSLIEMQSSPAVKREAWTRIQQQLKVWRN